LLIKNIVADESYVDENGEPSDHGEIHSNYVRIHPDYLERCLEGFFGFFPQMTFHVFESMEDFSNNKNFTKVSKNEKQKSNDDGRS